MTVPADVEETVVAAPPLVMFVVGEPKDTPVLGEALHATETTELAPVPVMLERVKVTD